MGKRNLRASFGYSRSGVCFFLAVECDIFYRILAGSNFLWDIQRDTIYLLFSLEKNPLLTNEI